MDTMPYLPILAPVSLIILEHKEIRCYSLESQRRWTIGRKTLENIPDIEINSPIAGRKHGEFIFVSDQWFYCDKGSLNGTFYNGKKIESGLNGRVRPVMLHDGDVLRIDYRDLNTPDPRGVWMLFTTTQVQGKWAHLSLRERTMVIIGRDEQCDIVQSLPYISAHHAKIMQLNGSYYVSDCDSNAGTWLNGEKIHKSQILKEKDCISICDCHFIFTGHGLIYNERKNIPQKVNSDSPILSAEIKSKKVNDQNGHGMKELIRGIHLELKSGQLIALLGGSGAGKSTLMSCLNGTDQSNLIGKIVFQGEDLCQNFERLKCFIGSVPQENILHEMLTIDEELRNAAVLRLPGDIGREEIQKQVDETLKSLNLESKRRTKIKKLSGGEKKRVNIGIELVADRKFLCLDEPDAGLDPLAKKELFMTLHKLVRVREKCILAIIYDVSEIDLFDQLIMMVKVDGVGRLAYSGTPSQARQHFNVERLSEVYAVIDKDPERYVI